MRCELGPLASHQIVDGSDQSTSMWIMGAWKIFHSPPLCWGNVEQENSRIVKYNRSEVVHPAIWDSFVAYPMLWKSSPQMILNSEAQVLQRASAFSSVDAPCQICLGGQHGCPQCFECPEGLRLNEYSYMPGDVTHAHLHTDLTTRVALEHDRRIRHDITQILFKSIPCGATLKIDVLCDYGIAHLHHLFRSACVHGLNDLALFYVPTEKGLIEMDMEREARHDLNRGLIPLFRYGINKSGQTVIFHSCHYSMSSLICIFIHNNLLLAKHPCAGRFLSHLDTVSELLPGADAIQLGLWDILA